MWYTFIPNANLNLSSKSTQQNKDCLPKKKMINTSYRNPKMSVIDFLFLLLSDAALYIENIKFQYNLHLTIICI